MQRTNQATNRVREKKPHKNVISQDQVSLLSINEQITASLLHAVVDNSEKEFNSNINWAQYSLKSEILKLASKLNRPQFVKKILDEQINSPMQDTDLMEAFFIAMGNGNFDVGVVFIAHPSTTHIVGFQQYIAGLSKAHLLAALHICYQSDNQEIFQTIWKHKKHFFSHKELEAFLKNNENSITLWLKLEMEKKSSTDLAGKSQFSLFGKDQSEIPEIANEVFLPLLKAKTKQSTRSDDYKEGLSTCTTCNTHLPMKP